MQYIIVWVILCGISISVMIPEKPEDRTYESNWLPCVEDWEPPPREPTPVPVPGTIILMVSGLVVLRRML